MEQPGTRARLGDWLWFLVWGGLSSWWCLSAAAALGPTFDEPLYVARGLEGWRNHSHHGLLALGTMPLPIDVQTLPLYLWERCTGATPIVMALQVRRSASRARRRLEIPQDPRQHFPIRCGAGPDGARQPQGTASRCL